MSENALLTQLSGDLDKLITEQNQLIDEGMDDRIKTEVTDLDEREGIIRMMGYRDGLQGALGLVRATLTHGALPAGRATDSRR